MHKGDAIPFHDFAVGRYKPSVVAEDLGGGIAILLLVGVQHEVAPGGIECAISGMTVSVVKNGGVPYADVITTYVCEISGCGGFYPGEAAAARYDIIAELGTLRYFERFETCASVENLPAYLSHLIQSERLQ